MHIPSALYADSIMRIPLSRYETNNPFSMLECAKDVISVASDKALIEADLSSLIEDACLAIIAEDMLLIAVACEALIEEMCSSLMFDAEVRRLGSLLDEDCSDNEANDYSKLCELACIALLAELQYEEEVKRLLTIYESRVDSILPRSASLVMLKSCDYCPLDDQAATEGFQQETKSSCKKKVAKIKIKSKQVWEKIKSTFRKLMRPTKISI